MEQRTIIIRRLCANMQRLTLIKEKVIKNRDRAWVGLYRCTCGNEVFVANTRVNAGHTLSCGCLQKEKASALMTKLVTTHGQSKTQFYRKWRDMIARCTIPSSTNYQHYGGRGISVCERWLMFENFYKDMQPTFFLNGSLERVDNNGNYTPENCKWIEFKDQAKNKRKPIRRAT